MAVKLRKQLQILVRRATRSWEGGRPPLPFFENQKKFPDFGKKGPDCVHPWVKFTIQNVILRVSMKKKLQNLSLRSLIFLNFWQNVYRSAIISGNLPSPEKLLVACLHVNFSKIICSPIWFDLMEMYLVTKLRILFWLMMMMMNCFWCMVDRRKAFSLISRRDHCHRSSPSQICDTPWAGFEPAQKLSLGLVEWSCAVVITTTPQRHWCWN